MKQSKDSLDAAFDEQESPPDSPIAPETETPAPDVDEDVAVRSRSAVATPSTGAASAAAAGTGKGKEDEEEEEEENMDVELGKFPSGDPDKKAKMQWVSLSQISSCLIFLWK